MMMMMRFIFRRCKVIDPRTGTGVFVPPPCVKHATAEVSRRGLVDVTRKHLPAANRTGTGVFLPPCVSTTAPSPSLPGDDFLVEKEKKDFLEKKSDSNRQMLQTASFMKNLLQTASFLTATITEQQQEKARMIHEKFEDVHVGNHLEAFKSAIGGLLEPNQQQKQQEKLVDDVGNHLEDFKSSNEGLEAKHSDLKGSTEKQRTSHQKLSAHFEGAIHTKLNNSVNKIYKRTFSSSPPYKPVKPEIPTNIKMEDFTNVHAFVMKLQQYHPNYTVTNMLAELKEKDRQLKLQKEYSAKAREARDRGDVVGAEEYEKLASEAGVQAEKHATLAQKMTDYEIYWRGRKAEYLRREEEEKKKKDKKN